MYVIVMDLYISKANIINLLNHKKKKKWTKENEQTILARSLMK